MKRIASKNKRGKLCMVHFENILTVAVRPLIFCASDVSGASRAHSLGDKTEEPCQTLKSDLSHYTTVNTCS